MQNKIVAPAQAGAQKRVRASYNPTAAWIPAFAGMTAVLAMAACTPTVKVEAPDKPIEINMNIKIEQEVRVRVDKDLDDLLASDPELFGTSSQKKQ